MESKAFRTFEQKAKRKLVTIHVALHDSQVSAMERYMRRYGYKTFEEATFRLFEDGLERFADMEDAEGV